MGESLRPKTWVRCDDPTRTTQTMDNTYILYSLNALLGLVNIEMFWTDELSRPSISIKHIFSGRVLLLTSLMVLVLMLRSLQTQLRNWGLSAILPLDHHVYLHKITGVAIFGLAWLHAIMHLINFGKLRVKLSMSVYSQKSILESDLEIELKDFVQILIQVSMFSQTLWHLSKWTQTTGRLSSTPTIGILLCLSGCSLGTNALQVLEICQLGSIFVRNCVQSIFGTC